MTQIQSALNIYEIAKLFETKNLTNFALVANLNLANLLDVKSMDGVITEKISHDQFLVTTKLGEIILKTKHPLKLDTRIELEVTLKDKINSKPFISIIKYDDMNPKIPMEFKIFTSQIFIRPEPLIFKSKAPDKVIIESDLNRIISITKIDLQVNKLLEESTKNQQSQTWHKEEKEFFSKVKPGSILSFEVINNLETESMEEKSYTTKDFDRSLNKNKQKAEMPVFEAKTQYNNRTKEVDVITSFASFKLANSENIILPQEKFFLKFIDVTEIPTIDDEEFINVKLSPFNISSKMSEEEINFYQKFFGEIVQSDDKNFVTKFVRYILFMQDRLVDKHKVNDIGGHDFNVIKNSEIFKTMKDILINKESHGNWQGIIIPIKIDNYVTQINFYVRNQEIRDQREKKDDLISSRFIVELSTFITGKMQIDGLIFGTKDKKKLSMIIRTEEVLQNVMLKEIEEIFKNVCVVTAIYGEISFENVLLMPNMHVQEIFPFNFFYK